MAYRTQGQAIAAALDLAAKSSRGEPVAYWCTHHRAWHIGNEKGEESAA